VEPFKNFINQQVVEGIAQHFHQHYPAFNRDDFIVSAMDNFESLALKARTERITQTMVTYLPDDFEQSAKILLASLGAPLVDELSSGKTDEQGIAGWGVLSLTYYVALCGLKRGQEHVDLSLSLLKEMTKRLTAEFDIRFFLQQYPEQTLSTLTDWLTDENRHVRRLISEGTRPKLPWGMHLPLFIQDPTPVIALLEHLKDDQEEYVRRSVANNLNDIAKDHPDLVADIAKNWLVDASPERVKLVKHACRTLVKNGHQKTLTALGYGKANIKNVELKLSTKTLNFGEAITLALSFQSSAKVDQPLMIDYVVHHQKANGKTSPKVFKWRIAQLAANKKFTGTKKHAIKKITTRVYYPGTHKIDIMINGSMVASSEFELIME
jgi:3-methyladenine DNA glycosylase AlkC